MKKGKNDVSLPVITRSIIVILLLDVSPGLGEFAREGDSSSSFKSLVHDGLDVFFSQGVKNQFRASSDNFPTSMSK